MNKIIKHIKPYIGLILLAIVMLFLQAMADLALPDYMSKIVNIGIQQGGVESSIPQALSSSKFEKLGSFLNAKENEIVKGSYVLISNSAHQSVYQLKELNKQEIEELSLVMTKAFLALSGKDQYLSVLEREMLLQFVAEEIKAEYLDLGIDLNQIQNRYIFSTGIRMLLISLISALCIIGVGFFASKTAAGLARDLRKTVFAQVTDFSKGELDNFSTASLITRTTNDISQIQNLTVILIRMVFYAPLMAVGGIIKALGKNPSMSWIIPIAVAAIILLIAIIFKNALPKFKIMQKLVDKINLITRENLSGIMVIRAFNTQGFEENRFDKANKNLTSNHLFVNRVMVLMFPTMTLIMNAITLLIVWVGAREIAASAMQVGDMMAFMQYAMQIISSFLMMSMMFIMIPRAMVAAQRIGEVLNTETKIKDPVNPQPFNNDLKGVVEFRDVCFRYQGANENLLKKISFTALPGKTTAIIGSTGSGKSTLINLILRFYDVTEGQVLVNGVDVREVTQFDLRQKIGYVPQTSSLFSGTIESNLRYADQAATWEELRESAKTAQILDFILEKPQGFLSEIAQGGDNVSGGQKQRLSIARALVKKADILVFDDSFSALDFKTDAALRKALKERTEDITMIIIAQRIASIMHSEQIIVLDQGKIVGLGTHQELLKECETYQEIAYSQLSREELA